MSIDQIIGTVRDLDGSLVVAPAPGVRPGDGTVLKIPSPWQGALVLSRPAVPFTPAESARAHHLAELAEQAHLSAVLPRPACPAGHDTAQD